MKKYRLNLSAHEYPIRRHGLCTPEASSAPFSKLNYLSPLFPPVRFPPVRLYSAAVLSHHIGPSGAASVLQTRVIHRAIFRRARNQIGEESHVRLRAISADRSKS